MGHIILMDENSIPGFIGTIEAEKLGLDRSQIRKLLRAGKIQGVRLGHDWLVREDSLRHYLSNCGHHRDRRRRGKVGHSKKTS